ncbi:MAG TPA: TIR domain-containing protein [Acidobacteriaceae bacterium]|nr:TIR domain-containing protein [Acidobacteriaceae bacterium]
MPANVFISFDHDDQQQVAGLSLLKNNPKHPLDFHDHSLKEAVRDRSGKPITYPPSDPRSKPVRDEIISKFDRASKLVVLIGGNTHTTASGWTGKSIRSMK